MMIGMMRWITVIITLRLSVVRMVSSMMLIDTVPVHFIM
jgi:hypothetical protein